MRVIVGGVRLDDLTPAVPGTAGSDHHMRRWPLWQGRRAIRQCPHGVFHPDPDDVRWARRERREHAEECDRCCAKPRGIHQPGEPVRIGVHDFGLLVTGVVDHSPRHCDGDRACPAHDPTEHHMRGWPQWHGSLLRLTMRECPHGLLHPDPDDTRWYDGGHECDGCCRPPRPDPAAD